ncbi:NAD(P)-binding protein [Polyplosphaeria fusca]|uniref:NAD(P)-binding protein n=1 Tax=Polyplosphaeria fusca TaxID=682080 RepID=A0A9P4QW26_9PLEO|nr:NAD(P)-binding protein [Polyplosphaeria fusca]
MAPRIFITGGTGYIGGSVLDTIVRAHPEYHVSALLRKVPEAFSSTYPNVQVVSGDYDSWDVLEKAASEADVVVHNGDSDHEPSLRALIAGLLRRPTPGHLIHLSGTGIVSDFQSPDYLGKKNPKVWSDVSSLSEIASLPANALHRNTEVILNQTVAEHGDKIKIAIMCPPDIYGKGRGLVKTWSAYVPMFVKEVRGLGAVFWYGEGENTRSWVHIEDLMSLYLNVVEAAAAGGGGAEWNDKGYYFASTQEHTQRSVAEASAPVLKRLGVMEKSEHVQVGNEQLAAMVSYARWPGLARYLFASNSRTVPDRAKRLFGYEGKAPSLLECLEADTVDALGRM